MALIAYLMLPYDASCSQKDIKKQIKILNSTPSKSPPKMEKAKQTLQKYGKTAIPYLFEELRKEELSLNFLNDAIELVLHNEIDVLEYMSNEFKFSVNILYGCLSNDFVDIPNCHGAVKALVKLIKKNEHLVSFSDYEFVIPKLINYLYLEKKNIGSEVFDFFVFLGPKAINVINEKIQYKPGNYASKTGKRIDPNFEKEIQLLGEIGGKQTLSSLISVIKSYGKTSRNFEPAIEVLLKNKNEAIPLLIENLISHSLDQTSVSDVFIRIGEDTVPYLISALDSSANKPWDIFHRRHHNTSTSNEEINYFNIQVLIAKTLLKMDSPEGVRVASPIMELIEVTAEDINDQIKNDLGRIENYVNKIKTDFLIGYLLFDKLQNKLRSVTKILTQRKEISIDKLHEILEHPLFDIRLAAANILSEIDYDGLNSTVKLILMIEKEDVENIAIYGDTAKETLDKAKQSKNNEIVMTALTSLKLINNK